MLLKVICQLLYSYFINNGTHLRITELTLCLSFKFTFGELYGDNRIYSLSYSFTAQRNKLLDLVLLLLGLLIVISRCSLYCFTKSFMTLFSAFLNAISCVPPSTV